MWLNKSTSCDAIWLDNQLCQYLMAHFRNESFRGFYKGLGPSLLRVVPASAITFVVYEKSLAVCRDKLRPKLATREDSTPPTSLKKSKSSDN